MSLLAGFALLALAAPWVLWPLIRHWQPEREPKAADPAELRRLELDEIELDLASGRISAGDAAARRRDPPGR